MAALDTNVVVRLLVGDDPAQARAAAKRVAGEACTISPSVLMECEWVLRGSYKLDAVLIAASFRDLLALQNIEALDPVLTQHALQGYEAGLDFADALHAAQRRDGERFVTFDRQLTRRATKAGVLAVELLKA
ncbi:MAG: type II toxin-antitoxin system VapC family toxin [Rubrivivax sp.]